MLKKSQRINKTRELQKVYRLGRNIHTSTLVIKFVQQSNPAFQSRVGLVVSKKVSKKAVERNRIKRVLREEMRKIINSLDKGDYMIVVKPNTSALTNELLRQSLHKALKKGLLI